MQNQHYLRTGFIQWHTSTVIDLVQIKLPGTDIELQLSQV